MGCVPPVLPLPSGPVSHAVCKPTSGGVVTSPARKKQHACTSRVTIPVSTVGPVCGRPPWRARRHGWLEPPSGHLSIGDHSGGGCERPQVHADLHVANMVVKERAQPAGMSTDRPQVLGRSRPHRNAHAAQTACGVSATARETSLGRREVRRSPTPRSAHDCCQSHLTLRSSVPLLSHLSAALLKNKGPIHSFPP